MLRMFCFVEFILLSYSCVNIDVNALLAARRGRRSRFAYPTPLPSSTSSEAHLHYVNTRNEALRGGAGGGRSIQRHSNHPHTHRHTHPSRAPSV